MSYYIARTSDGTGMGHPAQERDLDRNGTRAPPVWRRISICAAGGGDGRWSFV